MVDLGWMTMSQLSQITRFKCSTNHKWRVGILEFCYNIPMFCQLTFTSKRAKKERLASNLIVHFAINTNRIGCKYSTYENCQLPHGLCLYAVRYSIIGHNLIKYMHLKWEQNASLSECIILPANWKLSRQFYQIKQSFFLRFGRKILQTTVVAAHILCVYLLFSVGCASFALFHVHSLQHTCMYIR